MHGSGTLALDGIVVVALVLAVGAWPCLLVSPYALHLPGYYEKILVGGDFSHFVTEWATRQDAQSPGGARRRRRAIDAAVRT